MNEQPDAALAGLLRVIFFLSIAALGIAAVTIGVTTIYESPSGGEDFGRFVFGEDSETANYNRNIGLVFGFIGIGTIAAAILLLGTGLNALRSGLLAAAVILVFVGVGIASGGSNDWLTFVISGLAFLTLLACVPWLDRGMQIQMFGTDTPGRGAGQG